MPSLLTLTDVTSTGYHDQPCARQVGPQIANQARSRGFESDVSTSNPTYMFAVGFSRK